MITSIGQLMVRKNLTQTFGLEFIAGWDDIGYSFLIGGDGKVYEARGWYREGAHTPGYNSEGLGISLIGLFSNTTPSEKMLDTTKHLIQYGIQKVTIPLKYHALLFTKTNDIARTIKAGC